MKFAGMRDQQLLRYNRQILLPQIDIIGQQKLLDSTVMIVGIGGLGSPVAMYLAAMGVGHLVLVDHDVVEISNLQRQIIYDTESLGQAKVIAAQKKLQTLNPEIRISPFQNQFESLNIEQMKAVDLLIDCSDNFTTRFAINAACVQNNIPLVSGAAIRLSGQIVVFINQKNTPCYRCLYPDSEQEAETCTENGVLAPLVGVIGSMQAIEAVKVLLSIGKPLYGKLLLFEAQSMQWRKINLSKDPACPVCSLPGQR